jgi:histone deacetylase 11
MTSPRPLDATLVAGKIPIAYHDVYNIKFCGMEKVHPFDASKWGNVFKVTNGISSVQ